jgi:chaperonin cofactor prefoldin
LQFVIMSLAQSLIMLSLFALASSDAVNIHAHSKMGRGYIGAQRERALVQTYNHALASSKGVTPVTRVVNLLKEMSATLEKEMEEDENLFKKLSCWCNDNSYAKKESANANSDKIDQLTSTIEMLTAKSKELKARIASLETEFTADKKALAEASAVRKQQLEEFHKMELDNIAALENLKAALVILSKHQDGAFPQLPVSFFQVDGDESPKSFAFDEFLRKQNFHLGSQGLQKSPETHFLQAPAAAHSISSDDMMTVRRAVQVASSLLQARHGETYMPSYNAASGEIFGVMKQLQKEMETDLSEAQKLEADRAANFAELRAAKTSEIEAGEKMAESKEDEKATCDNDLAEAKEDLGETEKALAEDEKFSANLGKTCKDADANFQERKKSRLAEIQAVAETIEILTGDEAKDAMDTTFSFVQVTAESKQRKLAAAVLRKARFPELSMLATSVELDAFTKVKASIDKMITTLKAQTADEVKKNNWCKSELQANEMTTMKTKDLKADLEAKSGELEATIKTLSEEIEKAHVQISELQVALQRASEDRKEENHDFQKTVADQTATAEILNKALDKMAKFYDEAALAQVKKQTPPVAQMEYSQNKGAGGVMSMIEKLIYDTKDITAKSKKSESESQAAYETLVADTNDSIDGLTKVITSKTKAKAGAKKDLSLTDSDLGDAVRELEDLGKTNADLHSDCDYVLKNFMIRQKARSEEVEALQQAKQILNGANA